MAFSAEDHEKFKELSTRLEPLHEISGSHILPGEMGAKDARSNVQHFVDLLRAKGPQSRVAEMTKLEDQVKMLRSVAASYSLMDDDEDLGAAKAAATLLEKETKLESLMKHAPTKSSELTSLMEAKAKWRKHQDTLLVPNT